MLFKLWLEATDPYIKKLIDPALMTYREFYDMVNPSHKHHDSSAYQNSVDPKTPKSKYHNFLYNKVISGINFEFRYEQEDKYDGKYVKTDEDGTPIEINGETQYYRVEELSKLFKNRHRYSFGVYDGNKLVAISQDEWGCLLVSVYEPYRKFGLGTILSKIAWEHEPGKDTGGCTPKGQVIVKKVHDEFVREYLQKGYYSYLVSSKQITMDKVKAITGGLVNKKYEQKDMNFNNSDNWLLFNESDMFVIYDKKIRDFINEEDTYWKEKAILAVGDVGGMMHNNTDYRLRIFGGETDSMKKFMMYLCVSWTAEEGNKPLYVYDEDLPFVDARYMDIKKEHKNGWVSLKTSPVKYSAMAREEAKFRKQFDRYDEFKVQLMELATSKYQSESE